MSEGSNEGQIAKLDKDQIDSIRLETAYLPPGEEAKLRVEIGRANHDLITEFGQYIPNHRSDAEIADRFLIMDDETKEKFTHTWFSGTSRDIYGDPTKHISMYTTKPEDVVYGRPLNSWYENFSAATKNQVLASGRSEEEAREFYNEVNRYGESVHEISHLYQNDALPSPFLETAAYYYQWELEEFKYSTKLADNEHFLRVRFFNELLAMHGEDVHKLFFGSLDNTAKAKSILDEFTPEVETRLFPNTNYIQMADQKEDKA